MMFPTLLVASVLAAAAGAQSSSSSTGSRSASSAAATTTGSVLVLSASGSLSSARISTVTNASVAVPTGPYQQYTSQRTVASGSLASAGIGGSVTYSSYQSSANRTTATATSSSHSSSTTGSILVLGGNANATATTAAAAPTNTQPCNDYVEFCDRKYSNITQVCAHNSFFHVKNNAASNQLYGPIAQLNDGIRMIQGETHYVNNTLYACHSSCDLLNAGTLESNLAEVAEWVQTHPYDVVTILFVNSDFIKVQNYTAPLMNSGLGPYLYEPPKIPMRLEDWPTLGEMILTGKRVAVFMDYEADQAAVPYIMDEFSQMWETPFSPTDPAFPCTQQRPPNLDSEAAQDWLYLANHNLNIQIDISNIDILIPNYATLGEVNAASGNASLGLMANNCRSDWEGRPPNFLLVDYYNIGNGSVFEVAAEMNNVTYNRKCCGYDTSVTSDAPVAQPLPAGLAIAAIAAFAGLMILV